MINRLIIFFGVLGLVVSLIMACNKEEIVKTTKLKELPKKERINFRNNDCELGADCDSFVAEWLNNNNNNLNNITYTDLLGLGTNQIRLIYGVLPAISRANFWIVKLQLEINAGSEKNLTAGSRASIWNEPEPVNPNEESSLYNSSQIQSIQNLKNMLDESFFLEENKTDSQNDIAQWMGINKPLFNGNLGILKAILLDDKIQAQNVFGDPATPWFPDPMCACSTESNWCGNNTCDPGGCQNSPSDCGSLWQYDCDGLCDNSNRWYQIF